MAAKKHRWIRENNHHREPGCYRCTKCGLMKLEEKDEGFFERQYSLGERRWERAPPCPPPPVETLPTSRERPITRQTRCE
jgi:hypothetical protein